MKIQTLLFAVWLSASGGAFASDITINLDAPDQSVTAPNTVTFMGVIVNNDPAIVDLNYIEVDLAGLLFQVDDIPFFSGPPTVGATNGTPKTETIDFEFFDVVVESGAPFGIQSGSVTILGGVEGPSGYDPSSQNVLGSTPFQIDVDAPEPATAAMTFGAVALLYLLRRRKSNSKVPGIKP